MLHETPGGAEISKLFCTPMLYNRRCRCGQKWGFSLLTRLLTSTRDGEPKVSLGVRGPEGEREKCCWASALGRPAAVTGRLAPGRQGTGSWLWGALLGRPASRRLAKHSGLGPVMLWHILVVAQ